MTTQLYDSFPGGIKVTSKQEVASKRPSNISSVAGDVSIVPSLTLSDGQQLALLPKSKADIFPNISASISSSAPSYDTFYEANGISQSTPHYFKSPRDIIDDQQIDDERDDQRMNDEKNYMSPASIYVMQHSTLLTPSDYISPFPQMTYTHSISNAEFKLGKLVEELFDTEVVYVDSLTMLKKFYIDPLVSSNSPMCGIPFILLQNILQLLIQNHLQLLKIFQNCGEARNIQNVSKLLEHISSNALSVHLYEEYCNVYEDVLKLVKQEHLVDKLRMNETWTKGWQNFLEATQPSTKRMDLSFISLIQRPIARLSKYKLIAVSTAKHVAKIKNKDDDDMNVIDQLVVSIKNKLMQINDQSQEFEMKDKTLQINEVLDFENINCFNVKLSLQFFGKNLLCGILVAIWLQRKKLDVMESEVRAMTVGSFLYKSHLILCDVGNKATSKKHDIKFIIPLSKCQISENLQDTWGGLYSNYPYTIKLIYENGFRQYELLLVSLTKNEFLAWRNYLKTIIEVVNGMYPLDYSDTSFPSVVYNSDTIAPYDICLYDQRTYERYKVFCYFKMSFSVCINIDFYCVKYEDAHLLAGYYNSLQNNDSACQKKGQTLSLKKSERLLGEARFFHILSKELPILLYRPEVEKNRSHTLKKSISWTSIKMNTIDTLRHSNSTNDIFNYDSTKNLQPPIFTPRVDLLEQPETAVTSRLSYVPSSTLEKNCSPITIVSSNEVQSTDEISRGTGHGDIITRKDSKFRKSIYSLFHIKSKSFN